MSRKSYLGRTDLPRGLRNNNPGNLVKTNIPWEGKIPHSKNTDSRFEQFIDIPHGIRAKMRDIINDVRKGQNTIAKLIKEFAPEFENNTAAYINTVNRFLGLKPNDVIELTEENVINLAKAISLVENGTAFQSYITDNDYRQAIAILGIPLKKKAT